MPGASHNHHDLWTPKSVKIQNMIKHMSEVAVKSFKYTEKDPHLIDFSTLDGIQCHGAIMSEEHDDKYLPKWSAAPQNLYKPTHS